MHCGKRQAPSTNQPTNVVGSQYPPMKRDFIACGNAVAACVLHVLGTGIYICMFVYVTHGLFVSLFLDSIIYLLSPAIQIDRMIRFSSFLLLKKKSFFFFFFFTNPLYNICITVTCVYLIMSVNCLTLLCACGVLLFFVAMLKYFYYLLCIVYFLLFIFATQHHKTNFLVDTRKSVFGQYIF